MRKLSDAQMHELYEMGKAGVRHKDIANKLGISEGSVSRILVAAGITRYWTKTVWRKAHKGL